MSLTLNADQSVALQQIIDSWKNKATRHLLTGFAGVGKTTLMQEVVRTLSEMPRYADKPDGRRIRVAVTAPTHKAVQVLQRKLNEARLGHIEAITIHSLLGLKPGVSDSEKAVLKRNKGKNEKTGDYDAVIIDEVSMVGSDLQHYINNDLRFHWVLYVGDPAQLPPVGEEIAPCFADCKMGHSHLGTIVRQAANNPILKAATALREQQGGEVDWSWCRPAEDAGYGIYLAGDNADEWMKDAFTSGAFRDDNDAFRYIAYTNERVHEVNKKIRGWIYGETPTPFVAGERVVCRNPVMDAKDRIAFHTNQEAIVTDIYPTMAKFTFHPQPSAPGRVGLDGWDYDLPVWRIGLKHPELQEVFCDVPRNPAEVKSLDRKLVTEAKANPARWYDRFQFIEKISDIRPVYALTAHSSQGGTFRHAFVDIPDMAKLERFKPLELQKLLYVAVTRASHAVVLVGC